jgi:thiamine pyrophosphokinase
VTGLTLEGMKYPLENATLTGDTTRGISNEIAADMAHISLTNGRLLVFETKD